MPGEWYGLPPGEAVSLGIHESQSRMWENLVGRSRAFWRALLPGRASRRFPTALGDVSLDAFYFAINDVRPSLIRVEADEATYNLHILIRFELEQALLADELTVADLPAAWNEKYEQYLGIRPPSDADGVLQDVHWSAGLVGYFPTYCAGQSVRVAVLRAGRRGPGTAWRRSLPGASFARSREWLGDSTSTATASATRPAELVQKITGKPLSHGPLMRHLREKLAPLYGLN